MNIHLHRPKGLIFAGVVLAILSFFPSSFLFARDLIGIQGSIRGKVLTKDGQPAEYASVELLRGVGGSKVLATTRVDKQGEYVFENLEPGDYTIAVSFVGQLRKTQTVTISGVETVSVNFTLEGKSSTLNEVLIVGDKYSVTARKRSYSVGRLPLSNLENPQVYSVVNKALMQEQMAVTLDEAFRNVPGAAPSKTGAGIPAFFSRGFTTSDNLRNGMATYTRTTIDLSTVERVEAIKGPSGTLFGATMISFGGLVNYITKKPYDHLGGEVSYTTGSFGFSRVTADLNAPLNADTSVMMRLNTAWQQEGSFQDQGQGATFVFAPSLAYRVNDRLTLRVDADMQHYKGTSSSAWWIIGTNMNAKSYDQLKLDYKRSLIDNSFVGNQSSDNVFIQAEYKLSKGWTSTTNYAWATGGYNNLYYFNLKWLTDSTINRDLGAYAPDRMGRKHFQQNFNGDFKIGEMRNRLVVGVDFMSQFRTLKYYGLKLDTINTNVANGSIRDLRVEQVENTMANTTAGETDYRQYSYSAYFSDVLNITPTLLVMASLRADRFVNQGTLDILSQKKTGAYKQTALSPKFGIVYQPIKEKVALFANYMNGFKNVMTPAAQAVTDNFKPQQANQWEGGLKLDLLHNKLNATLSYYDIRVSNSTMTDPNDPARIVQDGTQESKGFEAEVIGNPFPGFNFVSNYGYNENKYTKATAAVVGKRAGGTPKHVANIWVSHSLVNGGLKGLGAGVGAMYVSEAFYDQTNSFVLPAYKTIDASLFYNLPKWRLSVKANNLTNQHYWVSDGFYVRPQKTVNFLASVALKF